MVTLKKIGHRQNKFGNGGSHSAKKVIKLQLLFENTRTYFEVEGGTSYYFGWKQI
jgi:hypothetical protein